MIVDVLTETYAKLLTTDPPRNRPVWLVQTLGYFLQVFTAVASSPPDASYVMAQLTGHQNHWGIGQIYPVSEKVAIHSSYATLWSRTELSCLILNGSEFELVPVDKAQLTR